MLLLSFIPIELLYIIIALLMPYCILIILIAVYGKRRAIVNKSNNYRAMVTVFIPTYNEEKHIAKKLDNLLKQDYPKDKMEILIYDCSTDFTPIIVEDYAKKHGNIKLIRQKHRIGMARTFNEAIKEAKGDILIKTDCDSLTLSYDAISKLVSNFVDDRVGAVSGIVVANEHILEKNFRSFMHIIQRIENYIDSTLIAHSTSLLAFRRSLLEPVNNYSMAEDTEEFLLIRKKGYKAIVDDSVVSVEEIPDDYNLRREQKSRRAQGIIQVLLSNVNMIFNAKYGRYGLIVLPMELFILVISPFLLIALGASIAYALFIIHPILPLTLTLSVIGLARVRSSFIGTVIDTQLSSLIATIRVLLGKNNALWHKVR